MGSRGPGSGKGRGAARPGSRTSSTRPAAGRAPSRSASQRDRPEPQGGGLWRWAVIAVVMLVLVVLLAPTLRSYFAQRGEIGALERQVAQGEERVAALEAERDRWRDPAYVEQQARERLKFVRPGEVSYTVLGGDELDEQQIATGAVPETRPWYDRMVASIGQADRTESEPAP
jgi:cell division protein FtsB